MLYITRKEHFNAAHRLFNALWNDEENEAVFGKCSNKNFHGHNYNLFVTVRGNPNPETGLIVNAKNLSALIKAVILDKVDHKNLNLEVAFLNGIIPSTENLAKAIWNQLNPHITECELHCVRLFETENIYAEYYGE
ncbi:MAG: 6-carboxytetrahydropterin synthase [Chitinophagales bacterium]|nr:6-carboxytetrahydropterin synthase [Chitinophagales bacterium]